MTKVNHWGKYVDSDVPVTGVLSNNSIKWEFLSGDETCLTCEKIYQEIDEDENLSDEEKDEEKESVECDPDHTRLLGDWKKDEEGKYIPDETGEFAAIERETTVQVVWSKYISTGALCSPCYPGQVDLDSTGEFKGYTLPSELLYRDETEDPEDPEDSPACPYCGGESGLLGTLGRLTHYRCINCGMDFSRE